MPLQFMSLGRQVHYRVSPADIAAIAKRGDNAGPAMLENQLLPLIVTAFESESVVSGQVILNGPLGMLWKPRVENGTEAGCWSWPEIL